MAVRLNNCMAANELIVPVIQNAHWVDEDSACKLNYDEFFLENADGSSLRGAKKRAEADRLIADYCLSCTAVLDCRADAIRNGDEYGVKGALTEEERKPLIRAFRKNGGLTQEQWTLQHAFTISPEKRTKKPQAIIGPPMSPATDISPATHLEEPVPQLLTGTRRPITAGDWIELIAEDDDLPLAPEQEAALFGQTAGSAENNLGTESEKLAEGIPAIEAAVVEELAPVISVESLRSQLKARKAMLAELRRYPGPAHEKLTALEAIREQITRIRSEIEQSA
jgi:hypothetical protein